MDIVFAKIQAKKIYSLNVLKPYRDYFAFGGLDYILVDLFR